VRREERKITLSTIPHELAELPAADAVLLIDQKIQEDLYEKFTSGQLTAEEYRSLQQSLRIWQGLSLLLTAPNPSRARTAAAPEEDIQTMRSEFAQFSPEALEALRLYTKYGPEMIKDFRVISEHWPDFAETARVLNEMQSHLGDLRGFGTSKAGSSENVSSHHRKNHIAK
jgi:hypothetical protein